MAQLTINFEGLICHVGSDALTKMHATLVHEPDDHDPLIRLRKRDLDNQADPTMLTLEQWDVVTFDGLVGTGASTTTSFRDATPSLQAMLKDGDIDPKVKDALGGAEGAVAHVMLPKGTLSVPYAHPARVKFTHPRTGTDLIQCVPLGVQFKSDETAEPKVTIVITRRDAANNPIGSPRKIVVASNAEIAIENVSSGGVHFAEFRRLTSASAIATAVRDGSACTPSVVATERTPFTRKLEKERKAQEKLRNDEQPGAATSRDGALVEKYATSTTNPECTNSAWP